MILRIGTLKNIDELLRVLLLTCPHKALVLEQIGGLKPIKITLEEAKALHVRFHRYVTVNNICNL